MGAPAPPEVMVRTLGDAVIRCLVLHTESGTQGDPPVIEVDVLAVVRGSASLGRATARWAADSQSSFYAVRGGAHDAWRAQPLHGPPVGETWIGVISIHRAQVPPGQPVVASPGPMPGLRPTDFTVIAPYRWQATAQREEWLTKALAEP